MGWDDTGEQHEHWGKQRMKADETAEIMELMGDLRHEGLTPLNVILQGTMLLLDDKMGELSAEQRKLLEMIRQSVVQATHSWYATSDQLRIWLDQPASDWTAVHFNHLIKKTRVYFQENRKIALDWPDVPEHSPRLRANSDLAKAFVFLLDSLPIRYFLAERPPTIETKVTAAGFQIYIGQRLPFYDKERLAEFYGPERKTAVYERIIAQHNGQIDITPGEEQVAFVIHLPTIPQ